MRNFLHRITFGLVMSQDQIEIIQAYEQAQGQVRMTYKGVMEAERIKTAELFYGDNSSNPPGFGFGGRHG